MATTIQVGPNGTASDVDFRGYVQQWQAALTALGWARTADTGQINSATVTNPVANGVGGYEVYAFTDALQATKPVHVKVYYGNTASGAGSHRVSVAVGMGGTNGAGTLLTPFSPIVLADVHVPPVSSAYSLRASGSTNRVAAFFAGGDEVSHGFSVERTHADDGTDTGEGVFLVTCSSYRTAYNDGARGWSCAYIASTGAPGPALVYGNYGGSYLPMPWWDNTNSMVFGLAVGVIPLYMPYAGVKNPSMNLLGYNGGDVSNDSIVTLTQYGAVRTYRCMAGWLNRMDGTAAYSGNAAVPLYTARGAMIRWE